MMWFLPGTARPGTTSRSTQHPPPRPSGKLLLNDSDSISFVVYCVQSLDSGCFPDRTGHHWGATGPGQGTNVPSGKRRRRPNLHACVSATLPDHFRTRRTAETAMLPAQHHQLRRSPRAGIAWMPVATVSQPCASRPAPGAFPGWPAGMTTAGTRAVSAAFSPARGKRVLNTGKQPRPATAIAAAALTAPGPRPRRRHSCFASAV